jgi:hypothetical protein
MFKAPNKLTTVFEEFLFSWDGRTLWDNHLTSQVQHEYRHLHHQKKDYHTIIITITITTTTTTSTTTTTTSTIVSTTTITITAGAHTLGHHGLP